jgi:hypothetical protein
MMQLRSHARPRPGWVQNVYQGEPRKSKLLLGPEPGRLRSSRLRLHRRLTSAVPRGAPSTWLMRGDANTARPGQVWASVKMQISRPLFVAPLCGRRRNTCRSTGYFNCPRDKSCVGLACSQPYGMLGAISAGTSHPALQSSILRVMLGFPQWTP